MNQFIQSLVTNNLGGQSITAVMRQGQTNLGSTGIVSDAQIPVAPSTPPPTATNIPPAEYPYP